MQGGGEYALPAQDPVPCQGVGPVLEPDGSIDYAVLAKENRIAGKVIETENALMTREVEVLDERRTISVLGPTYPRRTVSVSSGNGWG